MSLPAAKLTPESAPVTTPSVKIPGFLGKETFTTIVICKEEFMKIPVTQALSLFAASSLLAACGNAPHASIVAEADGELRGGTYYFSGETLGVLVLSDTAALYCANGLINGKCTVSAGLKLDVKAGPGRGAYKLLRKDGSLCADVSAVGAMVFNGTPNTNCIAPGRYFPNDYFSGLPNGQPDGSLIGGKRHFSARDDSVIVLGTDAALYCKNAGRSTPCTVSNGIKLKLVAGTGRGSYRLLKQNDALCAEIVFTGALMNVASTSGSCVTQGRYYPAEFRWR